MKRSPLKAKRDRPRRNEGRVSHGRMRPKASAPPTAEQDRYHAWLRETVLHCECGCRQIAECTHHILSPAPGKVGRRDHWFVVRLANDCHNLKPNSVHGLGSEAKFMAKRGVDLPAVAVKRLEEWRWQHGEGLSESRSTS